MSPSAAAADGVGSSTDAQHAEPPAPPKLKKFFKSRNTAPPQPPPMPLHMPMPPVSQTIPPQASLAVDQPADYPAYQSSHSYYHSAATSATADSDCAQPMAPSSPKAAPKIRLKINKRQLVVTSASPASDAIFPSDEAAAEVAAAVEHSMSIAAAAAAAATAAATAASPSTAVAAKPPAKVRRAPAAAKAAKAPAPAAEPTRKLARARKAVNYSEVRSRSASPVAKAAAPPPVGNVGPPEEPVSGVHGADGPDSAGGDASPSKEHPPIKLRIFKVSLGWVIVVVGKTPACMQVVRSFLGDRVNDRRRRSRLALTCAVDLVWSSVASTTRCSTCTVMLDAL